MSYQAIDANSSIITVDSSIISGSGITGVQRPIVNIGSIIGNLSVTNAPASVSGVGIFDVNHVGAGSVLVLVPGSVKTAPFPASVSGVGLFNVNHIGNGSVITAPQPASVSGVGLFNVNHIGSGSVFAVLTNSSVSGIGLFNVNNVGVGSVFTGFRNDTLASVVGVDLTSRLAARDAAGRNITKPFAPDHASVNGIGSVNGAASVILMVAPGAGLKNYLTDFTVSNTGAATTLVRITAGGGSILAFTIAPTGGGSNMVGINTPISAPLNSPINLEAVTASSVVYGWASGYKAP